MQLPSRRALAFCIFAAALFPLLEQSARGEAMVQYFNTSWNEIAQKMPELAEAGYDSIWIPPPTKAGGGLSVGYDLFDPFDLGSKDQRGSVSTRYGTQADLLNMITVAHRFGIRIYLDNVMNHRGFDIPGYNASTPIDIYPGLLPEDFHLQLTQDGFYRNWPGISNYSDQWQVWNLSTSNLADVAQEPGTTNANFGLTEGSTFPKIAFVRNPNNPEYYCFDANGNYVGFGGLLNLAPNPLPAGFATPHDWAVNYVATHSSAYTEYVQDYLNRNARWLIDITKADGLRLDAIKHVRYDFFGASFGSDKDYSDYGYLGQAQRQFNLTRGFNDPRFNAAGDSTTQSDLRETVFDTERPRHNLMFFGEHLGGTAQQPYIDAGSRLLDNNLQSALINELPTGPLNGLDSPGGGGLPGGPGISVGYAQSADNGYMPKISLAHAFLLSRAGLNLIYTDGNHHAGVLGQISKAFPANANTNFLGQYSDPRIPNMLYVHNQFARGDQISKWSDNSVVAWERRDKRENSLMTDSDGTTMLFMMNGNSVSGQSRGIATAFPPGSYLWQYATGTSDGGDPMPGFYYTVPSNQVVGDLVIPKGGYFVLSWRNPEEADGWSLGGGKPITILQNGGQPASTLTYLRKDGPDGDPNFNPYNVAGAVPGSYSYPYSVPLVTNGSNLSFIARVDGSAENVLMELDGGVDINSQIPLGPTSGEKRDNPPGLSTDVFLGYEQAQFVDRDAPEKFAAIDTTRCQFGSVGAETYTGGGATVNGSGNNPQDVAAATFVYHDPNAGFSGWNPSAGTAPATQYVDNGSTITVYAKTNSVGGGFRMFFYYTSDGSNPEGADGYGLGTTQVAEMHYQAPNTTDGNNWWGGASIPRPVGTIEYKIGIFKTGQGSQFPDGVSDVFRKKKMMTTFQVTNFNATTAPVYPHNDYSVPQTGLSEGFHVLRARTFLKRDGTSGGNGLRASIYNTFTQVFYYDAQAPQGEIDFPTHDGDSIGGQQYGVVVRTDPSVTEVWYKIVDSDPNNDDTVTTVDNGNGAWVKATELTANPTINSQYPNEWRFNYVNIPSSGAAQIYVRLRELSSADSTQFTPTPSAADDQAKHYTTLTRNVNTNGPQTRMFVAFPSTDGQVVNGGNYIMKVWFSDALISGLTSQQAINNFLISISSSESGSAENPVVQPRSSYSISYNVNNSPGPNQLDELAYPLPSLYNGQPDFLHTITVTYTQPPPTPEVFTTTRLVKMQPITVIQDNILSPPEFDADGNVYQIVLPDVTNATPAQRTVPITVQTDPNATNVAISFTIGSVLASDITLVGTSSNGSNTVWTFNWTNVQQGDYQFVATVTTPSGTTSASRDAHVVFKQIISTVKGDSDDDGLSDVIEAAPTPLPSASSDTWTNDQVHLWKISGLTDPTNPDTDNDGLSDGLELGWGSAVGDTNTAIDTNGDGVPNFQPDLDPPVYNVTFNSSPPAGQDYSYFDPWPYNYNNSRTDQIAGSVTDPNKPDTDGDGLNDGVEDLTFAARVDANSNPILDGNGHATYRKVHTGRVEILPNGVDGETVIAHPPTIYNTSTVDRSKVLAKSPNAVWLETDPNNTDTDGDGAGDGSEDANHNGIVDLAIIDRNQTDAQGNFVVLATFTDSMQHVTVQGSAQGSQSVTLYYSDFCYTYKEPTDNKTYVSTALSKTKLNAVFRPGGQFRNDGLDVIWLETDPRLLSTSGDGLPDGWKIKYGLDPFDDGVIGDYNMRTGKIITNTNNGPNGDPDGDGVTNLQEFINGTNPTVSNNAPPPPAGSLVIGPGTSTTVGGVTNDHAFTDWNAADLIALDPYDGDGTNFNAADIYHAYDGWDTSRDMVAFYAHDGGDPNAINPNTGQHGDGNFYFRVDFEDLQAYAEQGNLDLYIVINFGNPGTGEYNLPDQIDTGTSMKWQAVVACYQSNVGTVYLWNKNSATHSTAIGQDLTQFGVTARNQNTANGFGKAYFNSDIDAVEFSVSRQALLDAGWNGDPTSLIYQVYTTKDGTQDNPVGAGDIGGRSDIRDSIRNDWIASDYYLDQQNIDGANSVLRSWVGLQADNDNGKRVKVVSLIHANHGVEPGSVTQNLINNGQGAGFYRPLDAHQAYNVPLTLHITPTLASAIQWAKVGSANTYKDGPALNARIASMIQTGTIDLLGSTFSDHVLRYFSSPYNIDNVALANDFLTKIYGASPSTQVFWTPERVSDSVTLQKASDLGYQFTFVDQMRHIFKWFGRSSALGSDGYRINQINNTKAFVVNDSTGPYLLQNTDNGVPTLTRQLLNRKARDSQQDQVVIFENEWDDFAVKANADAYDKNIRWLASHPWIQIVTPDQIAANQVSYNSNGGTSNQWGNVSRGTNLSLPNVAKDFIDHADEENYDNWYFGSSIEESLSGKAFNIRTGVPMPTTYGWLDGAPNPAGIVVSAWQAVTGITLGSTNGGLLSLARATLHASEFETAFHNQTANDLSKFSTGAYIYPDTGFQNLAGFSKNAQAQTRNAAIYSRVNQWAQNAAAGTYSGSVISEQSDVDLDGEQEYLIYNDRLFALFERIGGRMVGAWLRDIDSGYIFQVAGNFSSDSNSETEEEGAGNFTSGVVNAYRTSDFKDWFAKTDNSGNGTFQYVNDYYSVVAAPSGVGWKFTSSDGKIAKTITLAPGKNALQASYATTGLVNVFARFGLSPDLYDLLTAGQSHLGNLLSSSSEVDLFNNNSGRSVRAYVKFGGTGFSGAAYNASANDSDANILDTVPMRNQAQTQQVELQGPGAGTMNFALGFETGAAITYDSDGDGIPDWWTQQYFGHSAGQPFDSSRAGDNPSGDGLTNLQKYILGLDPTKANAAQFKLVITRTSSSSVSLTFPSIHDRLYQIQYASSVLGPWMNAGSALNGTASTMSYVDDGTDTGSPPSTGTKRFYKLQVSLVP